jgi:transposase
MPGKTVSLPTVETDAAGIDIGVQRRYSWSYRPAGILNLFDVFKPSPFDLQKLADWLRQCGIRTVAMESTGVYWIPLFQILEQRKIDVQLVNAHHVKNVPGSKTDVADCQWISGSSTFMLADCLQSSLRPDDEICAIRSFVPYGVTAIISLNSHH